MLLYLKCTIVSVQMLMSVDSPTPRQQVHIICPAVSSTHSWPHLFLLPQPESKTKTSFLKPTCSHLSMLMYRLCSLRDRNVQSCGSVGSKSGIKVQTGLLFSDTLKNNLPFASSLVLRLSWQPLTWSCITQSLPSQGLSSPPIHSYLCIQSPPFTKS